MFNSVFPPCLTRRFTADDRHNASTPRERRNQLGKIA